MKLQIVNKSNNPLPEYKTKGSVGMDICSNENWNLIPNETALISTGLYIAVPEGFEAQIRPRSGLAIYAGITILNTPGTIDSDYRGEIKVILHNTSEETFNILIGDRIAQMVICPIIKVELEEVEELDSTERGINGFGSTGIGKVFIGTEEEASINFNNDPFIEDYEFFIQDEQENL